VAEIPMEFASARAAGSRPDPDPEDGVVPDSSRDVAAPGDVAGHPEPSSSVREPVDELFSSVYGELRALAGAVLQRSRRIEGTCATSLVHDAYVRLAGRGLRFRDRAHFLCLAAKAMRYLLVDRARQRATAKRGGGHTAVQLDESIAMAMDGPDLLAIEDALTRLSALDERKGRIVELRFFGGLSVEETAEVLDTSPATVIREWSLARAWLFREIGEAGTNGD
jgi:RNA polymerase sigma-70 factor (ECF subfamily)